MSSLVAPFCLSARMMRLHGVGGVKPTLGMQTGCWHDRFKLGMALKLSIAAPNAKMRKSALGQLLSTVTCTLPVERATQLGNRAQGGVSFGCSGTIARVPSRRPSSQLACLDNWVKAPRRSLA